MVKNKKNVKKDKKGKLEKKNEEVSLDDAFADDEDVVYAQPKPKKVKDKKGKGMNNSEMEEELEDAEEEVKEMAGDINGSAEQKEREITFKASKPISKIKKGDKMKIDGIEYEVDTHYLLMNHGSTNEMAIEIFNQKTEQDYQLRYFDDQVESTIDFYELREIMYFKKPFSKIEW